MSDASPAAVQAATPAPGSQVAKGGMPAGPTSSPVNSQSASSKANQQAAAAGEAQGLSNKDQTTTPPQSKPNQETQILQATETPISLNQYEFESSGNKHLDQIKNLLLNNSFEGVDTVIKEVLTTQELSLESQAKMVKELGADIAQLAINQLENVVNAEKQRGAQEGKRLKEYAFGKLGGNDPESTWQGMVDYFNRDQSFTEGDRKAFNHLLGLGGTEAEIALDSLVNRYQQSSGYTNAPNLMQGDFGTQAGMKLMSKKEYQEQIGPAIVKYGESSQEVQALRNRRAISMSQGYN